MLVKKYATATREVLQKACFQRIYMNYEGKFLDLPLPIG